MIDFTPGDGILGDMRRILTPLLLGLFASGFAAGRPFTNTSGKTIDAEVASATATTASGAAATC